MTTGKSLTEPPKNLKEAIDWVLRVSGDDNIFHSDTDKLVKALNELDFKNTNSLGIELQGSITGLASGLKKFIGYESRGNCAIWKIGSSGIGKSGEVTASQLKSQSHNTYTSAYYGSAWDLDVEIGYEGQRRGNKKKTLRNFFTAIKKIFEGLTELYYNCRNGWKNENLGGSNLQQFMDRNGFRNTQLNTGMKGERIISQALKDLREFTTAYNSASTNPSLDAFRSQLEQNASTDPSKSPLAALYILATYVYVQSSNPATPSFAGYSGLAALGGGAYGLNLGGLGTPFIRLSQPLFDCPSNLKEAVDWILRVTGRDGSGGDDKGQALAGKVKKLLEEVENSGTQHSPEIAKVKDALGNGKSDLIAKLAEGLQQFIGYNGQDGIIEANKGIAVSNLPVERLRDAVLMFVAPFLGVLRYTHPELKDKYSQQLGNAVEACKNGVGCGKTGFDAALGTVAIQLGEVSGTSIDEVVEAVKNVDAIKSKDYVQQLANGFKEYFKEVLQKVEKDKSFTGNAQTAKNHIGTLNTNLQTLVGALTELRNAFPDPNKNKIAYALSAAAYNGVNLFVTVLQTDYTSYYKDATWPGGNNELQTCAKIFLACLPLLLNGLSYFYWKCSDDKGWKDMTLGSPEPNAFIGLTSIGSNRVKSGRKGSDILSQAFKNFK
ncbi:variant erythrocyte surface antigen-1, alpha subunit [Babesia caballi]|uniref:Variant erythrocyte surface antigen-1, alpha subunit n=1 Tax=Babesia caballi TaxID=5871 RepID=A0AAV4LS99_BABCB|nr:variant erythrocyte surface antigen-1, alpha subunit [Babesia caballi]